MEVPMGSDLTDFMRSALRRVRSTIAKHGYAVQNVLGDECSAPFSYTIGLHRSHGYELVMTGIAPKLAESLLHTMVDRFADIAGPEPGMKMDRVLGGGYQVQMRRVDSLRNFSLLRAVFGEDAGPVYWQALWPDSSGVFPAEPGCSLSPGTQPFF
ncbi:hypothetical protein CTZ27_30200 [Streptomyces griseocarneus]|nr:hypothetical protein CTZ27_30200 [Streptomyces griseocarneus]